MEVVFKIEAVTSVEINCWNISGRAYECITVGDIVLARLDSTSTNVNFTYLTVIAISTYGRSINRIDKMLTGVLTVNGTDEQDISKVQYLEREGVCD